MSIEPGDWVRWLRDGRRMIDEVLSVLITPSGVFLNTIEEQAVPHVDILEVRKPPRAAQEAKP